MYLYIIAIDWLTYIQYDKRYQKSLAITYISIECLLTYKDKSSPKYKYKSDQKNYIFYVYCTIITAYGCEK